MGGCGRSSRLRQSQNGVRATLREMARALWDEAVLLLGRVSDLIWRVTPHLLTGPGNDRTRAAR